MERDHDYSAACLREIEEIATKGREQLKMRNVAGADDGCLILGNSYSKAPFLFCGLNPGDIGEGPRDFAVGPCSEEPYSYPFRVAPEGRKGRGKNYFRNCHDFCERHSDLGQWFYNSFTSTFLIPWRTKKVNALWSLNSQTDGSLFRFSGELLTKMIEHHEAKLLILSSKISIKFLQSLMATSGGTVPDPCCFLGPGGTYQWSRTHFKCRVGKSMFCRCRIFRALIPGSSWTIVHSGSAISFRTSTSKSIDR